MGNFFSQGDDGVSLNWYSKLVEGRSAAKGNAVGRAVYDPFKRLGLAILNRKDDKEDSKYALPIKAGDGRRFNFEITPVRYATVPTLKKTSGFQIVTELVHTREGKPKDELFHPLKFDDDEVVSHALYGDNRDEILVTHGPSNIAISRRVLQCLIPGGWLNDEVINLYLELLKERERREHKKFLKCHFFNTFFYKKYIQ
ncbi:ubiquitin-like-specific protease ESD4 [Phalaenopsis equestris]|uniref:ubiquitin-like-specific protease ESD4 n=1 Tax=Phalaenopsis equestris TaxID=78828 RepID=UPI0009E32D02|nr:ubiquitin-like-specific protease ESD4 [Phalaenopsis equestris]